MFTYMRTEVGIVSVITLDCLRALSPLIVIALSLQVSVIALLRYRFE
jgi:hypothetical protein